jgi:hypothetical protein
VVHGQGRCHIRGSCSSDKLTAFALGTYVCDKLTDPKCVGGNSIFTRTFQKGKRYLLRLINASTESTFIFSIDNHMLEVISRLVHTQEST